MAEETSVESQETTERVGRQRARLLADLAGERGVSGTNFFGGFVDNPQEYLSTFTDHATAMRTFREMRRSDPTVRAVTFATELMARGCEWEVDPPADATKFEIEVTRNAKRSLFEVPREAWQTTLHRVTSELLWAGFSLLEMNLEVGDDGLVWATRFAPRLPDTLWRWNWDWATGDWTSVEQDASTTEKVPQPIPRVKCVHFVLEPEGDDPRGVSPLRFVYRPAYMLGEFEKIQAIALERGAVGIPTVKLPNNAPAEDEIAAEKVCRSIRAHERAFAVYREPMELAMLDQKATQLVDCAPAIQRQKEDICRAFLAQMIMLGTTATGARSLGDTFLTTWLVGVDAINSLIAQSWSKQWLARWTEWNYGTKARPATLRASSALQFTDAETLSKAVATLAEAGMPFGDRDAEFLRKALRMPTTSGDVLFAAREPAAPGEPPAAPPAAPAAAPKNAKPAATGVGPETHSAGCGHDHMERLIVRRPREFPRALTRWEQLVPLRQIEGRLDDAVAAAVAASEPVRKRIVASLDAQARAAYSAKDPAAISAMDAAPEDRTAMRDALLAEFEELRAFGRQSVAAEHKRLRTANMLGAGAALVTFAADDADGEADALDTAMLDAKATQLADEAVNRTVGTARTTTLARMRAEMGLTGLLAEWTDFAERATQSAATHGVSTALNTGRDSAMREIAKADPSQRAQYSSVLDERTCGPCAAADGTETTVGSLEYSRLDPPYAECEGADLCRCIWVLIGADEVRGPGGIEDVE